MRKIIAAILLICFINTCALAVEFDSSIDSGIRKDYNVEEYDLPALPSASASSVPDTITTTPEYNPTGQIYTLKRGTKINLISKNNISDWLRKNQTVSFALKDGITSKDGTIIPAGTILKGTVVNSHRPQLTGNGGLVELKTDEIYYNGLMSKIESKVSRANSKKVFRNDIKGKRSYWSNYSKAMTPGRKVFGATQTCAAVMSPIPVVNIFSFIPLVGGAAVYTVNFAVAPIIAIFTKGGSLSLPAGTEYQIKITKDSEIRG